MRDAMEEMTAARLEMHQHHFEAAMHRMHAAMKCIRKALKASRIMRAREARAERREAMLERRRREHSVRFSTRVLRRRRAPRFGSDVATTDLEADSSDDVAVVYADLR